MSALVDTHCHLDDARFDDDREAAWSRARSLGVTALVIPAVEPATWDRALSCALPGERFVALGVHPQALPGLDDATVDAALDALPERARAPAVVAIGECGLDGAIDLARAPWERQVRVLLRHVEVARALDLPLVLHVYRAHERCLRALEGVALPSRPGVVHSYSGSADLVKPWVARGFHLSFAGAVTRASARRPVEAVLAAPAERLLVETDAPDQTPTGADAARCEPAHVVVTARRVAALRGVSLDALADLTTANARALFGLPG